MKDKIPALINLSGWMWLISGITGSIFVLFNSVLTLKTAEFNHSGIIMAGIFMILFLLVFSNVGFLLLKGNLQNLTGNALGSIVFSILILYLIYPLISSASELNFSQIIIIIIQLNWLIAGILVLISKKKYNNWISSKNNSE